MRQEAAKSQISGAGPVFARPGRRNSRWTAHGHIQPHA